ncbi:MAG TPA: protein kinase, partial [Actinomycetota bacterium]|nr:protein kinase [Actinomycetota bacterium]
MDADSESLAPGRSLGPYRLEDLLGEGAVGLVFRARRESDGEIVALKILRTELSGDESYRRRFAHEARAAQEVENSHLVPILDAGEVNGRHFLAVLYVGGPSLESRIATEGPLPSKDIA